MDGTETDWTREGLEEAGFRGFVPLLTLDTANVPRTPGLYVVVRTDPSPPDFLEASVGGWFKRRDPSVPVSRLDERWLTGTPVLYIGKAGGGTSLAHLAGRLTAYRRFCLGQPVGHWGGRLICQLADLPELLVAWRPAGGDAATQEKAVIGEFVAKFGHLPFANLRH